MSVWVNGEQIRTGFAYASENLKGQKKILNHLNVFPVADRDTGVNMTRSMERAAMALPLSGTPAQILEEAYLQLLEYAHGNSGTILTLFFEGFSAALPAREQISGRDLALAFQAGAQTAENAVPVPMAGTILTVASQSARAGISMLDVTEDAGLIFKRITDEAHSALLLTPRQNPILRKFQVIDSGAYGFCLILDGFLKSIAPELSAVPYGEIRLPSQESAAAPELLHRYCTEFVMEISPDTDMPEFEQAIKAHGSFYLCVSNGLLCKVHIHTNTPEDVIKTASGYGSIRSQKIDDMARESGILS